MICVSPRSRSGRSSWPQIRDPRFRLSLLLVQRKRLPKDRWTCSWKAENFPSASAGPTKTGPAWDGQESEVPIAQEHSAESDMRFIRDISSILGINATSASTGGPAHRLPAEYPAGCLQNRSPGGYCRDHDMPDLHTWLRRRPSRSPTPARWTSMPRWSSRRIM
jgi:hypothetical protein